ncbi:hypothetical protein CBR_g19888 [Chara braunii]|uniref:DDE Tnp4 domain-containing protein n=1 Tax=Chara braunii TaxID=69332 RepID=A0A388KYW7_CHABU|nr:hypothetical protein CBR_g19888 [Chara braunii]|eukprot:GBG75254.1 hypothetical protein CBR_g19888 [Chara braunii]
MWTASWSRRVRVSLHRTARIFYRCGSGIVFACRTCDVSSQACSAMDGGGRVDAEVRTLSHCEKTMVASAVLAVCRYMETVNGLRRGGGGGKGRREAAIAQALADVITSSGVSDAPFLMSNAIIAGVLPRDTPRWWMKRWTGGTWQDLDITDDATDDYFHDKLRMSRSIFSNIVAACSPFIERRLTHYREPLQPDLIVAFTLYRWASGETFESASSSFGIGRASGLKAVMDVTNAILSAYPDKIAMPTGRRLLQVTRAFGAKGFPNCSGAIDCTHVYVDKPANAPSENYYDRKQQFSVVAQVVVDLDMRILDVFIGYPGSVHDQRVLRNSSLFRYAEVISSGITATLQGRGWSSPTEGASRRGIKRAFGRLKGMWRLFLRHHKTNMDNLPQQFTAVCVIHNLLVEAGVPFDDAVLLEPDENGNLVRVDLGLQDLPRPVSQSDASDDALALRHGLRMRMQS